MSRRIVWSRHARDGLDEIVDFISDDDPAAALRWARRVRVLVERVAKTPGVGRWLPERDALGLGDNVREVILGAYRIIYRVEPGRLVVMTVMEGHRLVDPDDADVDDAGDP